MENDNGWDFNAPQYVDFSGVQIFADDDKADKYFDYDHENGVPVNIDDSDTGTVAYDVFSTPQSEGRARRTKSSTVSKTATGPGTPQRVAGPGTPQRVSVPKGSGTASVGTPQRVARSKSIAGTPNVITPQKVARSRSTAGAKPAVKKSVTPEPSGELEVQVESKDAPVMSLSTVIKAERKLQTPISRVTRSGKLTTPDTVEVEHALQKKKPTNSNILSSLKEWRTRTARVKTVQHSQPADVVVNEHDLKTMIKRLPRSLERSDTLPMRQKRPVRETGRTPNKPQTSNLQRSVSVSRVHGKPADDARLRSRTRGLSGDRTSHTRGLSGDGTSCTRGLSGDRSNHTRGLSGERPSVQRTRSGSNGPSKREPEKHRGMTIPTTPTLLKRKLMKSQLQAPVKNSEQLEMEKIAYYRQELAKKRKLAQESCKTALSSKGPTCVVQTKELTRPESFKFETDSRIKTHTMETRHDCDKDFIGSLRCDTGKQSSSTTKVMLTKCEPFNLTKQRKRRLPDLDEKQAEKYETMAEKLAYFTKTPDRFRSKPRAGPSDQKRGRSKSPPYCITVPKTPQFETQTRSRPVTAPTREDTEKREIEEMQKNQFKAQPVNSKIFKNPGLGIKKVPAKASTVPEEFHLSTKIQHHEREPHDDHYEFHAQPLNRKMLEGTIGVKEPKKIPVTVPESPAFALKHRARSPAVEEPKEVKPNVRSRAAPHFGIPFHPHYVHKATEPAPFGFEEREKKRAEEKKKKIVQVLEDEKKLRDFHANPLPDSEKLNLPPRRHRPLTVQQPFNLDTDNRGVRKAEEWSKKMEEELQEQKDKVRFKAKTPTVLEHEPFIPHKENKYTTDISEFEFNTAKRTVKRDAFEMHKKAKQDEIDNIRIQEQRMKEAEDRIEFERMRREAVHKANPVKQYKPMAIKRSHKPLTEPMSPMFQTDTRLRSRAQHEESVMSKSS